MLTTLIVTYLVACKAAAISAHMLCTPYNHAPVYSIISCKATYCPLVFYGRMTGIFYALPWGWNEFWNKSWHAKVTLGEKIPMLHMPGLEQAAFWSWVSYFHSPIYHSVGQQVLCESAFWLAFPGSLGKRQRDKWISVCVNMCVCFMYSQLSVLVRDGTDNMGACQ